MYERARDQDTLTYLAAQSRLERVAVAPITLRSTLESLIAAEIEAAVLK